VRKRFYILFVARDADGELRKIHIPLHYLYVFLAGAVIGMLSITGIAGSYTRMLVKVSRFNQLRTEKEQLRGQYVKLEREAAEREIQVASLSSLANEVSMLYGLKAEPSVDDADGIGEREVQLSMSQFDMLRRTALSGAATIGISMGPRHGSTVSDWISLVKAPSLWPVEGRISGAFGERLDPFSGEGAFHRGIDISAAYGSPVVAPAEGVVTFAGWASGYGKLVVVEHSGGVTTRYGHLSGFSVTEGQAVNRGDTLGYVGLSGRSTGPHLHYEVWTRGAPVNPHKYLRTTVARARRASGD